MTSQPAVTLESLSFHWADAYLISYARDRWVALRRDRHRFLTAGTLTGLETAIEADYRDHPVPRDFDPGPIQITCQQCGHTLACDASSQAARDQICGQCSYPFPG